MARKPKDAATKYLEEILAKIPEEKREAVKAALSQEDVLEDLGGNILRQEEFSRGMGEAKKVREEAEDLKQKMEAYNAQVVDWYGKTLPELDRGTAAMRRIEELKKAGIITEEDQLAKPGTPPVQTPADLSGFVRKEDVAKVFADGFQNLMQQGSAYLSKLNRLSIRHFKDFGEELDTDALVQHAAKTKASSWEAAYSDFAKDLITARDKRIGEEKVAKLRKEIEQEVITKMGGGMPYPMGDTVSLGDGASSLPGLAQKETDPIAAAVRDYNQRRFGS